MPPRPGAAFVADEALRRGWVVRLVTLAPTHLSIDVPRSLTSPFGSPPAPPLPTPVALRTVDHEVRDHRSVLRELAIASSGSPGVERWPGITCIVNPYETTFS